MISSDQTLLEKGVLMVSIKGQDIETPHQVQCSTCKELIEEGSLCRHIETKSGKKTKIEYHHLPICPFGAMNTRAQKNGAKRVKKRRWKRFI